MKDISGNSEIGECSKQRDETVDSSSAIYSELDERDAAEIQRCLEEEQAEIPLVVPEKEVEPKNETVKSGSRGMKLDFIPPTLKNGEPVACLEK